MDPYPVQSQAPQQRAKPRPYLMYVVLSIAGGFISCISGISAVVAFFDMLFSYGDSMTFLGAMMIFVFSSILYIVADVASRTVTRPN